MEQQSDMFEQTEDAMLAERLMRLPIRSKVFGMYRTSEQYVTSELVAKILTEEVGIRNTIEFCVTTLERRSGNSKG